MVAPSGAVPPWLVAAFESGRSAWPGCGLSFEAFVLLANENRTQETDARVHGADIYLAAALAAGDHVAIDHFEGKFISLVPSYVGGLRMQPHELEELRQDVRVHLLAGPVPKIRRYRGAGPLGAWLRVVTLRLALSRTKHSDRFGGPSLDTVLPNALGLTAQTVVPNELGARVQQALDAALSALAPADKLLLRLYFVDGLSIDELAVLLGVHRATAARRVSSVSRRIRNEVIASVANLAERMTLSEAKSALRALKSHLHLSMSRLLPEPEEARPLSGSALEDSGTSPQPKPAG